MTTTSTRGSLLRAGSTRVAPTPSLILELVLENPRNRAGIGSGFRVHA
jgi:hypothetical protein